MSGDVSWYYKHYPEDPQAAFKRYKSKGGKWGYWTFLRLNYPAAGYPGSPLQGPPAPVLDKRLENTTANIILAMGKAPPLPQPSIPPWFSGAGGLGGGGGGVKQVYTPPDKDATNYEVRTLLNGLMGRDPTPDELSRVVTYFYDLHNRLVNVPENRAPQSGDVSSALAEAVTEKGVGGPTVSREIQAKEISDTMESFRKLFGTG